jgi:hypothetical protein
MEKIMCLKPNMFCDEHTNRCQTRQRIENDLLTNFQQEGPKFRKEDHITLTGGGGTDAQRRHATGRYGKTYFEPAFKVLRKSLGTVSLLTPELAAENFLQPVPPSVCAEGADKEVAFMYCHLKIMYQRHMLNNGPNSRKTQALAEVLNRRRSSGDASDEDDNEAAVSGITPCSATYSSAELHTEAEAEHDTEVAPQCNTQYDGEDTANAHTRTTTHR